MPTNIYTAKRLIKPVGEIIEGQFTRTYNRSALHEGQIVQMHKREFGCDDYGALYQLLFKGRAELLARVDPNKTYTNQQIANLIAGTLLDYSAHSKDTVRIIYLEGFWLYNPFHGKGMQ